MRATTPRACRASRRPAATALAAVVLLAGVQFTMAPGARADETPSTPPGTESTSPPPQVDGNAPGLKLRAGATLAPAKVLDIISVVESEGGEERREDTNENVKFALQAEVLFGKDSARLSSAANSRIAAIADEIKKQGATKVRVFGFTDDLGSAAHGDVLSKQRAEAVHGVLQGQLTSAGITFEIRGYGEQYPIADNSTEEGRKKNRRVEVSFPRGESS
ncbi:OmpA family protein [Streptomyces scopuliridis]|uniref:OmpA family protein n=1 Tax=Streptomyces scopuliridis TaxID=452529 RepID=A0ACD4ZJ13_9ACTN|nr:OmpA family protein [Streptomyces scopuliridis]WSB97983.1 OmpA family protein [Streptomyces scopuliridis]WSC08315.1 OmpA family protein [Streptomyces scopuliridis]